MYHRLLVPIDGSDSARRTLEHAVTIADRFEADLDVLTVVDASESPLAFGVQTVEDIDGAIEDLVETLGTVASDSTLEVHSEVRRGGPPHEEILAYADEIEADLVVIGRDGTKTLPDAVLGSTTDRIARLSPLPVVIVPDED